MAVRVQPDSEIAALAPVQSVAGRTGDVTLSTSDISGLSTALSAKADLVGGYLQTSQIPSLAITEYLGAVSSQAEMLALNGDRGDWCVRSDTQMAYILSADDSSLAGSWVAIPHPTSPVLSVNGQTGAIVLGHADVGAQAEDATLTALAGVTTSADKLIYATGSDTFSTTTLSSFIRTVLDDADGPTVLSTIGAQPASGSLTATVTTATPTNLTGVCWLNGTDVDALNSTTDGQVLRVASGAVGWGTLPATSIGSGAVSDTEYGYLDGVTSAIQTQINGKQPINSILTSLATAPAATAAGNWYWWNGTAWIQGVSLAFGRSLLNTANAASAQTLLALVPGTNVLAPNGNGSSLTGLTSTQVGLGSVTNDAQTKAAIVPNTVPSTGQLLVGNAGGTAFGVVSASGDATISSTGAITLANSSGTRSNLGLGSMATQAASSVVITGGSVSGITDLAVADGGTGASDGPTACANLGAQVASGNLTATITTNTPSNLASGVLMSNGTDVDVLATTTTARVLVYTTSRGYAWEQITNGMMSNGSVPNAALGSGIDATKIGSGTVSNTQFGYVSGVTSAIQTQLDGKQASNADLTGIATLNTNGIPARTASGTYAARTITGTTNVITVTNGDGVSGNPTLTVGSLVQRTDTAAVLTAQQNFGAVSITSTTNSIAWNLATAQSAKHTFTENTTLANPTNMVDGGTYVLRLTQHASSPKTLAFGSAYKWAGGSAPTISSTAGAVDIITFTSDGTSMFGSIQKAFA